MSEQTSTTTTPPGAATSVRLPLAHLPAVVLPGATVTLTLATDEVRGAIEAAVRDTDGRIALTGGSRRELAVVARVPNIGNLPTGESAAIVQVERRARIIEVDAPSDGGATYAIVEPIIDGVVSSSVEAATRELRAALELIAELRNSRRLPELLRTVNSPGQLADSVALWAEFGDDDRLRVLQAVDVGDRVAAINSWARNHLNELQVAETIRNDVSEGMSKQQRDFMLRQQLAAIRKELGEGSDDVVGEYRTKLDDLDAPEGVKVFVAKELDRFERMSEQSPEHGWIRTWLDRIFEMPWGERSDDTLDLDEAQSILDADHYGLDDVKERIVEFLAARKLRHDRGLTRASDDRRGNGSVLTLVGPPGVGKTSLGESIARAMGRQFVRVALGGVRDEAEIRGHRRTYVGSQPGRIVKALQEAGTMNPVILLDEIDKMGSGAFAGDPTAAMLEVLDPAQNHTFRDHYLEVDLDLSEVVFIATANVADTIPGPLLDRMDLIRLDGYTESEKVFIAGRYLLPRQIERAGLRPDELSVSDELIGSIIRGWTREAGVRSLERELGRLVRKVTAKIATGQLTNDQLTTDQLTNDSDQSDQVVSDVDADVDADVATGTPITIGDDELRDWLGRPKVDDDVQHRTSSTGIATGLAVTGAGGDVLFVETTAFPTGPDAEPGLTLTGQLGDVMKESAQIALNYVRSHASELGLGDEALRQRFHVHVPAGAVPKDGPSAGVTITTALVSLLTGRPVKSSVAMTGEINLQGQVMPIGGVKQKVLAAHRMGITEVVLPARNGPDLEDVPQNVLDEMTIHLAATYDEVAAAAFDAA